MDIGEFFFKNVSSWVSHKEVQKRQDCQCSLSSCEKTLSILIPYFLEEWAEIRPAKRSGVSGSVFFFSPSISVMDRSELNRSLYLHLALMMAAAKKMNLRYPTDVDTLFYRAFYLSQVIPYLNACLDKAFPGFWTFQKDLLGKFIIDKFEECKSSKKVQLKLLNEFHRNLFKRDEEPPNSNLVRTKFERLFCDSKKNRLIKSNEPVPDYIWTVWGGLENENSPIFKKDSLFPRSQKNDKNGKEEKMKDYPDILSSPEKEYIDLDKEKKQDNPVAHSFEKLETADDYSGGYRTADGSDQLEEHSSALQEVDLKKVTRGGEAAESFLKNSFGGEFCAEAELSKKSQAQEFLYPEYNYKTKRFQQNHCRLIVSYQDEYRRNGRQMDIKSEEEPHSYKKKLRHEYRAQIERFQSLFEQIVNQKKWLDRQWEGPEVDIDAFTRYLTDLKSGSSSSTGQFYLNQQNRLHDFELFILVDSSLSTDSYVNNRRVIDVALESIGLMGLLLEKTQTQVSVALAWSESRNNCELSFLKNKTDSWSSFYDQAGRVSPKGYTRLGAALRHSVNLLKESTARKKILLLLTDGKPTDIDGYEGKYGIEDMRQAALTAHAHHIFVKAFAIEKEAKHYFPHMFGQYEILKSPELLPETLFKTYLDAIK